MTTFVFPVHEHQLDKYNLLVENSFLSVSFIPVSLILFAYNLYGISYVRSIPSMALRQKHKRRTREGEYIEILSGENSTSENRYIRWSNNGRLAIRSFVRLISSRTHTIHFAACLYRKYGAQLHGIRLEKHRSLRETVYSVEGKGRTDRTRPSLVSKS